MRNGRNWTQQAFLKSSNPGKEDWFGVRIAISGDGNTRWRSERRTKTADRRGWTAGQADDSAGKRAVYLFGRTGTA